jgi:hypothetical protein
MDKHCKLTCIQDGEDSGHWDADAKGCVCEYLRLPAMTIAPAWMPESSANH